KDGEQAEGSGTDELLPLIVRLADPQPLPLPHGVPVSTIRAQGTERGEELEATYIVVPARVRSQEHRDDNADQHSNEEAKDAGKEDRGLPLGLLSLRHPVFP